jgi:hypothetical protein
MVKLTVLLDVLEVEETGESMGGGFTFFTVLILLLHPVEVSTTKGATALVYCLINSSLYTGTVHRWWSTPNWLDGRQGCSQLSTIP